jgi:hypothetical protein
VRDSFWSWREIMYAAATALSHEDLEAIGARCHLDLMFAPAPAHPRDVMVGGRWVIENGVHANAVEIDARYRATLMRLRPALARARAALKSNDPGGGSWLTEAPLRQLLRELLEPATA